MEWTTGIPFLHLSASLPSVCIIHSRPTPHASNIFFTSVSKQGHPSRNSMIHVPEFACSWPDLGLVLIPELVTEAGEMQDALV